MGLENRIVYNLVDVINGSCRLKQALIRDRRHSELYLLPSAQTKDKTAVSPEQMIKLTDDLREEFDYVLLDCPAGIEQGFKNAVAGADRALVVTTPEVSAIRDADRIIGLLESGGLRDIRLIINRLRPEMIARGDMTVSYTHLIVEDSTRKYVDDESMAPILGYTGQASSEELETLRKDNPDYSNDAVVGKAGIEQYMELELQGKDGEETVTVDNLGKVLDIDNSKTVDPVAGNDVYLTIDSDWQKSIYQILEQRVAGIVLSKLTPNKSFDYEAEKDASKITIPIYDVYNALIANSVIDINKFSDADASDTEKNLYVKFQQKQQQVFDTISNRLTGNNPPAYKDEDTQMQEYLTYICDDLLTNTLKVLKSDSIDTADETYKAWKNDQSISLKDYLNYAASQNWIDISQISTSGEYLDSEEIYQALTAYIIDYLKTDTGFSKLLYKYMLQEDTISGEDLCLVLYEQGVLSKEDELYQTMASGGLDAYTFMYRKIANLEITPAQLARCV